jgi:hypothetical protein
MYPHTHNYYMLIKKEKYICSERIENSWKDIYLNLNSKYPGVGGGNRTGRGG